MAAALAAAIKDAPIPNMLELLSFTEEGFSSMEQLTLPTLPIAGKPRTGDENPRERFCTRHARVIDGVVIAAEMVAIFFSNYG